MKKFYFATALAAFALASCTSDDIGFNTAQDVIEAQQSNAIQFGTYMGKQAVTRAGKAGSLNTEGLKAADAGFGVFAFYTGDKTYQAFTNYTLPTTNGASGQNTKMANFMFNQQVKWNESADASNVTKWKYTPMKYWPNEVQNGAVDDQDNDASNDPATSTGENGGNVTFFAYAPYVSETGLSGETEGITAINAKNDGTSNAVQTDPIITYVVPTNANKIVDLLWGTYGKTSPNVLGAGSNAGVAYDNGGTNYQKAILPHYTSADKSTYDGYRLNADLTKQKTNGTVGFAFKHALAKVGGSETYSSLSGTTHGLMIIADIDDQKGAETGGELSSDTRITVTDIQIQARALYDADNDGTIEDTEYLKTMQGDLNLATGQWGVLNTSNTADQNNAATTNHNITSPATSSGVIRSAELNDDIAEPASVGTTWTNVPSGVTTIARNVYKSEATPLVFIPGTVPELTITINYTVRSQDSRLAEGAGKTGEGKWTYVKQVIKKRVRFANPVELNKQYSLLIHLGLTGVKFTATVSDWEVAGDTNNNGTIDTDENLEVEDVFVPINVGDATVSVTLPASTNSSSSTISPDKTLAGISAEATTVLINLYGVHKGNTLEISAESGNNDGVPTITPSPVTDSQTAVATVKLLANSTAMAKDTDIKITEKNNGTVVSTTYVKLTQVAAP